MVCCARIRRSGSACEDALRAAAPRWATRRSHLQVSRTHVLPVLLRERRADAGSDAGAGATLARAAPLIKEWLRDRLDRVFRLTHANAKPGSLETPHVLRDVPAGLRLTLALQPTAVAYAVLAGVAADGSAADGDAHQLEAFSPTPQTLVVTVEPDE